MSDLLLSFADYYYRDSYYKLLPCSDNTVLSANSAAVWAAFSIILV